MARRTSLKEKSEELQTLRLQLLDERIKAARLQLDDHEKRIRTLEASRQRIEVLAWLAAGGGLNAAYQLLKPLF